MTIELRDLPMADRDTRRDIAETSVIVNIQVRDGRKLAGYKTYVSREEWYAASDDERREAIGAALDYLMAHQTTE